MNSRGLRRIDRFKEEAIQGLYNGAIGLLDSPADQRAISNGYKNSPAGKAIFNKRFERIMNKARYGLFEPKQ